MPYKKIVFFTSIFVLLLSINNLLHSIYSIWQKQDLIAQAQKSLIAEKKENQRLKKDLVRVNQPQFIETEARDKLLLAKPGEGIVIIPQDKLDINHTPSQIITDTRPNWEKWWDIFFKTS